MVLRPDTPAPASSPRRAGTVVLLAAVTVFQGLAAAFFLADSIEDQMTQTARALSPDLLVEGLIALALLAGVVLGAVVLARLLADLRWKTAALAKARGALADHIALSFKDWGLTPGEADVAFLSLKGCDIAQIAHLRGAATGTVRSQLSQVYAKAGVTTQSMLVALFIEDLLDGSLAGPA